MRRTKNRVAFDSSRKWDRSVYAGAALLGSVHDGSGCTIQNLVVVGFHSDSYLVFRHGCLFSIPSKFQHHFKWQNINTTIHVRQSCWRWQHLERAMRLAHCEPTAIAEKLRRDSSGDSHMRVQPMITTTADSSGGRTSRRVTGNLNRRFNLPGSLDHWVVPSTHRSRSAKELRTLVTTNLQGDSNRSSLVETKLRFGVRFLARNPYTHARENLKANSALKCRKPNSAGRFSMAGNTHLQKNGNRPGSTVCIHGKRRF